MILGNDLAARTEIAKTVNRRYGLRSKVVHGAVEGPKKQDEMATVEAGSKIARQLLKFCIELGKPPDFGSVDLGGPF